MPTKMETATQILARALYDQRQIGSETAMVHASRRKRAKDWDTAREEFERIADKLITATGLEVRSSEETSSEAASAAGRVLAFNYDLYTTDQLTAFVADAKTAAASALTQKP